MTAPIIKSVSGRFLSGVRPNSKDVVAMATSKTYPSLTVRKEKPPQTSRGIATESE
jgi:hypothetical protein